MFVINTVDEEKVLSFYLILNTLVTPQVSVKAQEYLMWFDYERDDMLCSFILVCVQVKGK